MVDIGREWVQSYNGRAVDLTNTLAQTDGFLTELATSATGAPLGVVVLDYGDEQAVDTDFEEPNQPFSGDPGDDALYVEKADIVYYSGHGDEYGPTFGVTSSDDGQAHKDEVKWGNGGKLRWIVIDGCWVLATDPTMTPLGDDTLRRWKKAFAGLHQMLGFRTVGTDEPYRGRYFASYLKQGYSIVEAWKKACQDSESSSRYWAVIYAKWKSGSAVRSALTDRLPGVGASVSSTAGTLTLVYLSGPC